MVKRIVIGSAVLICLYVGAVFVALPVLEHTMGLGVYDKGTGVFRK